MKSNEHFCDNLLSKTNVGRSKTYKYTNITQSINNLERSVRMNKADEILKRNIENILENGVMSGDARPVYSNGEKANSKYVTQVCDTYDLSKGEFPITTLRQIPIKSAIKEIFWIYQEHSY